jgi:peptidoglycan/LPS O-acetylase OafA/YrhL
VLATTDDPRHLVAPVFAILVVLVLASEGRRSSLGQLAGGLSYALYLNHWIAVFAVHELFDHLGLPRSMSAEVLAYGLAVTGSAVHYIAIDRTIMVHRPRFFTVERGQFLRAAGYLLFSAGLLLGLLSWGMPFLS